MDASPKLNTVLNCGVHWWFFWGMDAKKLYETTRKDFRWSEELRVRVVAGQHIAYRVFYENSRPDYIELLLKSSFPNMSSSRFSGEI